MLFFQFDRPPEVRPPNFMMLQCHTTGTKNRSLGHEAERSTWALLMDNSQWKSMYLNVNCRQGMVAGNQEFYPAGLEYHDSIVSNPDPCRGESSCHMFSYVTPNWGHCTVDNSTI